MKSKRYGVFILCLIVVLVLFLFFVQNWTVSKEFDPRNLDILGLKAFYFFAARKISTFLFWFTLFNFLYRLYQIFYFYNAVHFSWGTIAIDLISIFALLALVFFFIPGLIIVNGLMLFTYLSAYEIDGITSSELNSLLTHMVQVDKVEPSKLPAMNGHMVVYGETEDKKRYICADFYQLIEKNFNPSLRRSGAVQTLKFFNVPDVVCAGFDLQPAEKPSSR